VGDIEKDIKLKMERGEPVPLEINWTIDKGDRNNEKELYRNSIG
jgi:hypothetical protein